MLSKLYKNLILSNPKFVFILLIITLISFGFFSKDFKLDASSDTLLIEGDPDLEYLREVTKRYGAKDFLVFFLGLLFYQDGMYHSHLTTELNITCLLKDLSP